MRIRGRIQKSFYAKRTGRDGRGLEVCTPDDVDEQWRKSSMYLNY